MTSNTRFALTIACFVGLAFIWGALFQASYIAHSQAAFSSLSVREIEAVTHYHAETADELAYQSYILDSIAFENTAEQAHYIDMPAKGDSMCATVRNDTIFVEYWRNMPEQQGKFRYLHGF
jgi:hypothetical protein